VIEIFQRKDLPLRRATIWCFLLIALALVSFAVFIVSVSVPFPIIDDRYNIDRFLCLYLKGESSKLEMIFESCNEHRLVFLHIISLAVFFILGFPDYQIFTYLGAFFWIAITVTLLLFCFWSRSEEERGEHFLSLSTIALFLLSPSASGTVLWPSSSLTHQPALFFSLMAIAFAVRSEGKISFFMVLLSCLLAKFSAAGGVLAGGVVLLIFLSRRRLWSGVAAFTFTLVLHFLLAGEPSPVSKELTEFGWDMVVQPLLSLGSAFSGGRSSIAIFLGVIFVAIFSLVIWREGWRKLSLLTWATFFLASYSAAVGLARRGYGEELLLQGRYITFSGLAWVCLFCRLTTFFDQRTLRVGACITLFALSLLSYFRAYKVELPHWEREMIALHQDHLLHRNSYCVSRR